MHLTVTLNSVCGLSNEASVVYAIATYGQQTFKTGLVRVQKMANNNEQIHANFGNASGTLYSATPSTLRILLVESCDYGDYCIASTTIQDSDFCDLSKQCTFALDLCSPQYTGEQPSLICSIAGRKSHPNKIDTNPTVLPIEQPETETIRTERLNIKLSPFGETFIKYSGLPPAPSNFNGLQAAIRRRSLNAGLGKDEKAMEKIQPMQQPTDAPPAPEESEHPIQAPPQKPTTTRRNSLMDTVVDKISEVSSNINKASSSFLHSVDSSMNRGLNKLNEMVGSLSENASLQRYQAYFPEFSKTETLLAEFECEALSPCGKLYPGFLMLTTNSVLFMSKQLSPTMYKCRMPLIDILSICRTLINGSDGIQVFDLNHNMMQFQHFTNFSTTVAEGVCTTIPTPLLVSTLSHPLCSNLFSRAFNQVEAVWESKAELPPPEFRFSQSQIPMMA